MKNRHVNVVLLVSIIALLVAIVLVLYSGCTLPYQRPLRLCSDYADRTTIDIDPLLRKTPDYIERRLSHLDSLSIVDSEWLQISNYRLPDGSRLKISFRDGYSIGFTRYHRMPYHTALKSLETFGFSRWELRNEEIKPYSHVWTVITRDGYELKVYALSESDFECWTMVQAFIVNR